MEEYSEPGRSADAMQLLLTVRPSDCSIEGMHVLCEYIHSGKRVYSHGEAMSF